MGLESMAAIRLAGIRLGTIVPISALAFCLTGCSTMGDLVGASRPGYQDDGSYMLTSQEQGLGCRELQERSQGLQQQMQALSERAVHEMQQVPQTIANAWSRLVGDPGDGVPAVAEYNEARAESAALNATLAQKGCSGTDTASIKR
jgi:hypothetical protein